MHHYIKVNVHFCEIIFEIIFESMIWQISWQYRKVSITIVIPCTLGARTICTIERVMD